MRSAARSSRIVTTALFLLATCLPPFAEASTTARVAQRSGSHRSHGKSKSTPKPSTQGATPSAGAKPSTQGGSPGAGQPSTAGAKPSTGQQPAQGKQQGTAGQPSNAGAK